MLNQCDNSPEQLVIKDVIMVQLLKSMTQADPLVKKKGLVQIAVSLQKRNMTLMSLLTALPQCLLN